MDRVESQGETVISVVREEDSFALSGWARERRHGCVLSGSRARVTLFFADRSSAPLLICCLGNLIYRRRVARPTMRYYFQAYALLHGRYHDDYVDMRNFRTDGVVVFSARFMACLASATGTRGMDQTAVLLSFARKVVRRYIDLPRKFWMAGPAKVGQGVIRAKMESILRRLD